MHFQDSPTGGHFIRATRVLCGLRLSDIADDTGFSEAYISMIERGHRRLTPEVAARIRRAFASRIGQ